MRRKYSLVSRIMAAAALCALAPLAAEPPQCASPKVVDQVRHDFDELQKMYVKSGRHLLKLAEPRDTGQSKTFAKALGYETSRHCEWKGTLDNGETTMVYTRIDSKGADFHVSGFCSTLYMSRYSKAPADCKDWRGPHH